VYTPALCSVSTDTASTPSYTLSLHDALPISSFRLFVPVGTGAVQLPAGVHRNGPVEARHQRAQDAAGQADHPRRHRSFRPECRRSEEHTSELQSRENLVCRLLLEKKKKSKRL